MAEQKSITQNYATPYKFTGKELDEETGLYYFGARYYATRESIWLSTDPLAEKHPSHSPYCYVMNNPINAIDPDGRYAVSVHYRITVNAMIRMGYSVADSERIAHRTSVYADHPTSTAMSLDNAGHFGSHHYRYDIDYSPTSRSQDESNSKWHSMMSDAEMASGMTHGQAMQRGLQFGWSNIMDQKNGLDEGKLGQGLHALQDAYAHQGASTDEHLGANGSSINMLNNDMYGNTSKAELITQSAVTVLSLFNKDNNGAGLSNGMQLDFSGMSKKQLGTVSGLFNDNGYILQASKEKGHYTLKQNF